MHHIILVDAEIELVPPELWTHPSVRKSAERRGKKPKNMLHDASFHHSAMKRHFTPEDVERRGRPGIAHIFCNLVQESALCRSGHLRLHIHTRNDIVLHIDPRTHLPKAYHRFIGLIESVFNNRWVPSREEPLIYMERCTLGQLLGAIRPVLTVLFTTTATADYDGLFSRQSIAADTEAAYLIGGFPHGGFRTDFDDLNVEAVRMFPEPYPAYIIGMELIADLERVLGIVGGTGRSGGDHGPGGSDGPAEHP